MPEDAEPEMEEEQEAQEEVEEEKKLGYKCVKCKNLVDIDPVEEKVICPVCSHRVLLKTRAETPKRVEAV